MSAITSPKSTNTSPSSELADRNLQKAKDERTRALFSKLVQSYGTRYSRAQSAYNFPSEFFDLEMPMILLADQLRELLLEGVYDTLISDEISGRIPTLVIRGIMADISKQLGDTIKMPATYFLAFGKGLIDRKALISFLNKIGTGDRKALLVTECLDSMNSMAEAVQVLESAGLDQFDIAAVSQSYEQPNYGSSKIVYGGDSWNGKRKVFVGHRTISSPSIYGSSPVLGGVEKRFRGLSIIGAHPERLEKVSGENKPGMRSNNTVRSKIIEKKWTKEEVQKNIIAARQDVKTLTRLIIDEVFVQ